ncbi:MAG: hypothetical protein KC543_08985 [Myxococcales bacterium]|nr:hypothetical protein [Myxococcales bacterium]
MTTDARPTRAGTKPSAQPPKTTRERVQRRLRAWIPRRHDPLTDLALTVPVFLFYQLGVVFLRERDGVDFFTTQIFRLFSYSKPAYALFTIALGLTLLAASALVRKRRGDDPAAFFSVIFESITWAVAMTLVLGWAVSHMAAGGGPSIPSGFFGKLVLAAGAGFHEELVFRVFGFWGGAGLLRRAGMKRLSAAIAAAILSSLAFSAVHYFGEMAYDLTFLGFTMRFLGGLILAGIFRARGFAVVVYTHVFYDVFMFFAKG